MLETIDTILEEASGFLWGYILLFGLLGTHLYLTLVLRFPQHTGKIRTLPMDIADPFGGDLAVYRQCLMQLRYCLQAYCAEGEE